MRKASRSNENGQAFEYIVNLHSVKAEHVLKPSLCSEGWGRVRWTSLPIAILQQICAGKFKSSWCHRSTMSIVERDADRNYIKALNWSTICSTILLGESITALYIHPLEDAYTRLGSLDNPSIKRCSTAAKHRTCETSRWLQYVNAGIAAWLVLIHRYY